MHVPWISGMDFEIEQITENVYHDMPLITFGFFAAINTALFAHVFVMSFNQMRSL
jgi:hypothetical protein